MPCYHAFWASLPSIKTLALLCHCRWPSIYVHKLTDATALQLAVLNFENMSNCARIVAYAMLCIVCMFLMTTMAATSAAVANDDNTTSLCYTLNNQNYCFYTNDSVMSWDEAREFCVRRNSTIPIITDENTDNVFQRFIVNESHSVVQNRYVWLGARARHVVTNDPWSWINGKQSRSYRRFLCHH